MHAKWAARGSFKPHPSVVKPTGRASPLYIPQQATSPRPSAHSRFSTHQHVKQISPDHLYPPPCPNTNVGGILVEYLLNGKRFLGSLKHRSPHDEGWVIESKDREITLSSQNVTFQWPTQYMGQIYRYGPEDISGLETICKNLIESNSDYLQIAWGNFVDKNVPVINSEILAKLLFGAFPKPHESYVAHCLLAEDKIYFELTEHEPTANHHNPNQTRVFRSSAWRCRSLPEVNAIKKQQREITNRSRALTKFVEKIEVVKKGNLLIQSETWENETDKLFISDLVKFAVSKANENETKNSTEILSRLNIGQNAFDTFSFLVSIKVFSPFQNLNPLRFKWTLELPQSEQRKYLQMFSRYPDGFPDKDSHFREDLRGSKFPTFAIDDPGTVEIDDSLSVDFRSDGSVWVSIHIADPSRFVNPNDELDSFVRKRVCSVFLPEAHYSMFPNAVMEQFSLLPSKTNCALSFLVQIGPNGRVEDYKIVPSYIDNVTCLSYKEADGILDQPTESGGNGGKVLHTLQQLAKQRTEFRKKTNSFELPVPDISIKNSGDYIHITRLDHQSPARAMVAEFMILVGELCADFASKNEIPIPYRAQDPPKDHYNPGPAYNSELASQVNGYQNPEFRSWIDNIMKAYLHNKTIPPARSTVTPGTHFGVGLPAYCQATSPIRRYVDLLVHYQIKSKLRGEKLPFVKEDISALVNEVEKAQTEVSKLVSPQPKILGVTLF